MIDIFSQTRIVDTNAQWWGLSISEMMENAGKGIAEILIKEYGKNKSYTFICGLGNNGGDGLVAARYLAEKSIDVNVFVIGREQDIKTDEAKTNFYHLKESSKKHLNLSIKQDAFAADIPTADIIVECLLGTGINGKVYKRFGDVIKKISKSKAIKVSIDIQTPGYKPDLVLTLHFQKTQNAKVVDIKIPKEVDQYVGPGEVNELYTPSKDAYKTQTGEMFIFGGSDTFHGAPMMAILGASKFIGSVYFYTTPGNRELLTNIKENILEFITVDDTEIEKYAGYADVILMGPGLKDNLINRSIIEKIFKLFPDKKKVLDAYAIAMAPKDDLTNCILTPHRGELRHLWGDQTNMNTKRLESNLRRYAVEHNCTVILKGHIDIIFMNDGEISFNLTGNAGMAKGGTGDILSGIIGSFATKNDNILAAKAGTFISGLGGDMAYQEYGYNYSATDLVPYLQKAVKLCNDIKLDGNLEKFLKIVNPRERV